METLETLFAHKKPNPSKLKTFGFSAEKNSFVYRVLLKGTRLQLNVTLTPEGNVKSSVTDTKTNEPYVLHLAGGEGKFVGIVRAEYEKILQKIASECFEKDVFKNQQTLTILDYALNTYDSEPEYLWEQYPTNAVLRRKDNAKWYAAILRIPPVKIGLPGQELIEILDLRADAEELPHLIDNKYYFPGYHMNKKHWLTLCLDNRLSTDEVLRRLDESYRLATK